MTTERIDPDFSDDRAPVVTYTRLEPRQTLPADELPHDGRREPTLEATRVLPLEDHTEPALTDMPSDLRADRRDDEPTLDASIAAGLYDDRRRSRPLRLVVFGAFIAIAAGVGVLAASLGIATNVATNIDGDTAAPATAAALTDKPEPVKPSSETASLEPADEPATAADDVRKISLGADNALGEAKTEDDAAPAASETASAPPSPPPVPRPRPELSVAVLEPPAPVADRGAEPADTRATAAAAVAAAPPAGGTDALITRIEETLAKRELASAVEGSGPPVLPPPPATVVAPDTAAEYPPADNYGYPRDNYGYPSAEYGYPEDGYPGEGPWVLDDDVMPPPAPPVAGRDYYPPAPVPPESVPYGYPADSWNGGPEAVYRGDVPEEKKPGFIRRALTKTTTLMSRVFSGRDERDAF